MPLDAQQLQAFETKHSKVRLDIPVEMDWGFRRFPIATNQADNFVLFLNTISIILTAISFVTEEDVSRSLFYAGIAFNATLSIYIITAVNLRHIKNQAYVRAVRNVHDELVGNNSLSPVLPAALMLLGAIGILLNVVAAVLFAKGEDIKANVLAIIAPFLIQFTSSFPQQQFETKNANLVLTINTLLVMELMNIENIRVAIVETPFASWYISRNTNTTQMTSTSPLPTNPASPA